MSTFLQVSGALFWLSLGAGGLWVALCYAVDWFKWRSASKPPAQFTGRDIAEALEREMGEVSPAALRLLADERFVARLTSKAGRMNPKQIAAVVSRIRQENEAADGSDWWREARDV